MNVEQAEILKQFFHQVAELASDTLAAFVEKEEKQVSIAAGHNRAAQPERELLNKQQLAKRLKISPRTISSLQSDGLPVVKIRTRTLFDYEKVLLWIEMDEIKSGQKTKLRVVK